MTSYYCRICGKRKFSNELIRCECCQKLLCVECEIKNRCIDCYIDTSKKEIFEHDFNSVKV